MSSELKACPFCGSAAKQQGKTTVFCLTHLGGGQGTCCAVAPSADEWNTRPIESALRTTLSAHETKLSEAEKRITELDLRGRRMAVILKLVHAHCMVTSLVWDSISEKQSNETYRKLEDGMRAYMMDELTADRTRSEA
jgi:hypothetical protein